MGILPSTSGSVWLRGWAWDSTCNWKQLTSVWGKKRDVSWWRQIKFGFVRSSLYFVHLMSLRITTMEIYPLWFHSSSSQPIRDSGSGSYFCILSHMSSDVKGCCLPTQGDNDSGNYLSRDYSGFGSPKYYFAAEACVEGSCLLCSCLFNLLSRDVRSPEVGGYNTVVLNC